MGFWLLRHGSVSLRVTKSRGGGAGARGAQPGRGPRGDSATSGGPKARGEQRLLPQLLALSLSPSGGGWIFPPEEHPGPEKSTGKTHLGWDAAPGSAGPRRRAVSGGCGIRILPQRSRGSIPFGKGEGSAESLGLPAPRALPQPGKAREWGEEGEEAAAELGALGPGREGGRDCRDGAGMEQGWSGVLPFPWPQVLLGGQGAGKPRIPPRGGLWEWHQEGFRVGKTEVSPRKSHPG